MSAKEYTNVVPFTYWVHPSNYLVVQDNIYIKKYEVTITKQPYIMAIKPSGVHWVVWNHTRDFKIPPSSIWNHKYIISGQNCTTRSSVQLPLYYLTANLKSQNSVSTNIYWSISRFVEKREQKAFTSLYLKQKKMR